jgi:Ni/Co efflux regulator RcnB
MIRALLLGVVIALASSAAAAKVAQQERYAQFFGERHWSTVRDFYNEQMRAGNCPIGFKRLDDGCKPPRHLRTWDIGKPLPPNAIRFDLPPALVAKLGKPPSGHRYVRVAEDILLVSNRSKLVVDGILNLGRR